jgi:hypothetical protein
MFFVVLSLYPTSMMAQRKARDLVSATHIAAGELEARKAGSFDKLGAGAADLPPRTVDGMTFKVHVEVTQSSSELKKVAVRVTWDPTGAGVTPQTTVAMETRIFRFVNP